jgi:integrase
MGRKSTGTVRILKNEQGDRVWHGKWTLADGTRTEWLPLPGAIPLDDEPAARAGAARLAPRMKQTREAEGTTVETVADYAGRWLDEREPRVNSIRDDRSRMRDHILPILGRLDARTFSRDDVERLRDDLDVKIGRNFSVDAEGKRRTFSCKTAASCWTLVTSMCDAMVNAKKREFRTRTDNPCHDVKAPERGARKAKQYLYPSEFLQFVSCEDVPLRWRRAVAVAIYTYTRDAELRVLRWDAGDVDLEHAILSVTRAYNRRKPGETKGTKSDTPRRFAIEPALVPLLRAMHDAAGGKGAIVDLSDKGGMANTLRRWLWKAGIRRPELHKGTPQCKPMTWHDLRATGATWMAVRGDDPLKIKQRLGHTTVSTTEVYIREAEAIRDGFGDVFPPLPQALLRIAPGRYPAHDPAKNKLLQVELTGIEHGTQ